VSRRAQSPFWVDAASDLPAPASVIAWLPWLVLAGMTLMFAIAFSWLSIQRHLAFQSHAFDLGNMDQAVWSTIHGHFLRFTDMASGSDVLTSRLAIHVEPFLLPVAVLYGIHGGVETLLTLQACVVASGAIPAYLLARGLLGRNWLALVFPAAYLLHPSLQNAVMDDFHAVALSASFLLWALYFVWQDSVPLFAAFGILAASTKEEVGLLVAAAGVMWLIRRRWYAGFMTMICGAGWFLVCMLWIIPGANPAGASPYLSRYAYLGKGLGGILSGIARHPGMVLHTLVSTSRLDYLTNLLHPLGFTSLLGFPVLLLALPALLINMMSSDPTMYSGLYQYSAEIVPFAIAASIVGVSATTRVAERMYTFRGEHIVAVLCAFILIAAAIDSRYYGFSPLANGFSVPTVGDHQRLESQLLASIPDSASVAAADELVPHLSERVWIYLLPTVHPRNGPAAQYVALDASIPSEPVEPHTLHAVAVRLLRQGYGVQDASDGVLVLRRGAQRRVLPGSFFSFIFHTPGIAFPETARWGVLRLLAVAVHPRDLSVNRSRPAIGTESYWLATSHLPSRTRITVYISRVYSGKHPAFSSRWTSRSDSPTWDWLPFGSWPRNRSIRAEVPPMAPEPYVYGSVDVAIGVTGLGKLFGIPSSERVPGSDLLRVATVSVDRVGG
jgi:uncharacterized membrane protein